jgi:DNA invertase Pin-like site-specific DNA recombinase
MSAANKITAAHLERLAVVYVRQSTIAQVREHTESTARQYALAQEAARLGWRATRISAIFTQPLKKVKFTIRREQLGHLAGPNLVTVD